MLPGMSKDVTGHRLWLPAILAVPGLAAVVGGAAELSGVDDPQPLTITLWCLAALCGLTLPPLAWWLEGRQRRVADGAARAARTTAQQTRRLNLLQAHFVSRGRGVTPWSASRGEYFTGRRQAMLELASWLGGDHPDDLAARVVTGRPGSGKSAVLGRVARFGHAGLRALMPARTATATDPLAVPPAGAVAALVNAQGLTADQVAAQIATDLGLTADTAGELLAALGERAGPSVGIVVDALDESLDPATLAQDLLEPIASAAGQLRVRLLVAVRTGVDRSLVRRLGRSVREIDLDSTRYRRSTDLLEYGFRLLTEADGEAGGPYRDRPDLARRVAVEVARRAGFSFLIVQLTCTALAAAESPVDVTAAGWQDQFPRDAGTAMDRYLTAFGAHADRARDLLLPLAWARGDGLADDQAWARLATTLGTARYTPTDVTWLLFDPRASYLLQRGDGEAPAYQLFHAALAEHLRDLTLRRFPRERVERAFAETLTELVPPRGDGVGPFWPDATEYTRRHLVDHARAAGIEAGLLADPLFVVVAEPDRLFDAVYNHEDDPGVRQLAGALEASGRPFHSDVGHPAKGAYLQLGARKRGLDELADRVADLPLPLPWSVPWTRWHQLSRPFHLAGNSAEYVTDLATTEVDGVMLLVDVCGPLAITALSHGFGAPYLVTMPSPIAAFAAAGSDVYLVCADGGLHHHDVLSRETTLLTTVRPVDGEQIVSCDLLGGGTARTVVLGGAEGSVWRCRPDGGSAVEHWRLPEPMGVHQVRHLAGRTLVVGVAGTRVGVWDLDRREPVGAAADPLPDHPYWADEANTWWSADLLEHRGVPLVLLGGGSRPAVLWEPAGGRLAGGQPVPQTEDGTMCVRADPATGLIHLGCLDGTVRTWRYDGGYELVQVVNAHQGGVSALAAFAQGGEPMLASGGRDGSTRVWRIEPGIGTVQAEQVPHGVVHVRHPQDDLIVTASRTELAVLDAATGERRRRRVLETELRALSLSPAVVDGAPAYVVTTASGQLRLLDTDLDDLATLDVTAPGGRAVVLDVGAYAHLGLAVVRRAADVQVWDLAARRLRYPPIGVPDEPAATVTVGEYAGVPALLVLAERGPALRVHDLRDGALLVDGALTACATDERHWEIATGTVAGVPVAAGVGPGGHVHVWDLAARRTLLEHQLSDGHLMAVNAVAIGRLHGRDVVVSGGYGGVVHLWTVDGAVGEIIDVTSTIWHVAVLAPDRLLVATSSGLLAIRIAPATVATTVPAHDFGIAAALIRHR